MAFDAYLYFKGADVEGETQDKAMKEKKAMELLSFEWGAENNINIGSISAGGGAGKATFKEFTITKKVDTTSAAMFLKLCEGNHFDDMVLELRRSDGAGGQTFLKVEFKLVMIQDLSIAGSDGDDIPVETVVMQFGAAKISYTPQDSKGKAGTEKTGEWSRVLNTASLAVE